MAITLGRAAPRKEDRPGKYGSLWVEMTARSSGRTVSLSAHGRILRRRAFLCSSEHGSVQLGGLGRDKRHGEDDVLINLADLLGDAGIDGRAQTPENCLMAVHFSLHREPISCFLIR
jgi:hypothetical protein